MRYLAVVVIIPIFCLFILSCKTGSSLSASGNNTDLSQYGDQNDLKQFVSDFTHSVEKGDWESVLSFFDRDNYLGQVSIGIGMHQYLIEGMMLPAEEFLDGNNTLDINNLKSLSVTRISYGADDCYALVTGEAFLSNGRRVPFSLRIQKDAQRRFTINPPVG